MDYRQLRAFIAVFEERNITAAAQRIHLTQPALSGSIKLLEESLGTSLFVRKARGVEVTDDARSLYPQARRMLAEAEQLIRRFRTGHHHEKLAIGIEQDIARKAVQHLVATAHACIPGLQLDMLSGCDGDARLGCEDLRCEDELFLPIFSESYVIATPASTPWADKKLTENDPLDDLVSWIMCPTHTSHQRLMPIYGTAASSPAAHASNFSLALDLVVAEVGIAIVPASLAKETAGIITHPLDTLDLKRRVGLCYPVQSLENGTLTLLRNALDIKSSVSIPQ
ncbi:MAG: LysR family transcriptional regulator [Corticimicrobacter sp.]|uniref:LysR family transcriptional regulator n=1 Tax=Corticimicrobacter sp. TaxID=2678536 RepID=UPI0032D9C485